MSKVGDTQTYQGVEYVCTFSEDKISMWFPILEVEEDE